MVMIIHEKKLGGCIPVKKKKISEITDINS